MYDNLSRSNLVMTDAPPLFTRHAAVDYFTSRGLPIGYRFFTKLCIEGGGPVEASRFGKRVLYTRESLDAWVETRMRPGKPNKAA